MKRIASGLGIVTVFVLAAALLQAQVDPRAQMISPPPGSTLPGSTVTFTWSPAAGGGDYFLRIGIQPFGTEIFNAVVRVTSVTLINLPTDGRTIYVDLYTQIQGVWQEPFHYTYTAASAAAGSTGLRFVGMPPCRVMETRAQYNFEGRTGAFGPPFMASGETRTLNMSQSNVCQIPATAKAYVLNVTLVPHATLDFVTVWPAGDARPLYWTARSPDGQIVANSAIVKAGTNSGISVFASDSTDIILDIAGYYTDNAAVSNLVYYPLTPCRVIETRSAYRSPAGPFGPPTMAAKETRHFTFPLSPYCQVPAGAAAYSMTITVVPPGPLAFLTAWPSGGAQPNVSSINSFAGRTLANSVIIPASADGSLDVFAFDQTDFLVDINGYYAPDNGQTGQFYFPVQQCRAADTTNPAFTGAFGGPIFASDTTRSIPVPASPFCAGIPVTAKGYALNVTAMPGGSPMPFLTLYPTGQPRPNASMLNAFEGQVATNSAIIPAGTNGSIDVYAFRQTHIALEISGYFGR